MTVVVVVWLRVGSVDSIVVGWEGKWRINKEEEKKNDERGGVGGGATAISVKFCCCSCSFVCFGVVGCLCCCHHGTSVLGEIPFFGLLPAVGFVRRVTDDGF